MKFQSEGITFYGVEKRLLRDLVHSKRPTILLTGILAQVVEACDVAKAPQYRRKKALSDFKSALSNTARRRWDHKCRVYYGHARRMMARLVVMYQGYYGVHPDEVDTFKTIGRVGKGPARSAPPGIIAVYERYNPTWSPLRILTCQLSALSEALSTQVEQSSGPVSFAQRQRSTSFRYFDSIGMDNDSSATDVGRSRHVDRRSTRSTKRALTGSADSVGTRPESLVVKLPVPVWDLSSQAVLRGLASDCLRDDLSSTQAHAMIEQLVGERQLLLLEAHRHYLTETLLPGLDEGDQSPHISLAVLLGFFDWSRANSSDAKAVLPPPDDDGGELYEALYNCGMTLRT